MAYPVLVNIADNLIAKSSAAGFVSTGLLNDQGHDWHDEPNATAAYLGDAGERNIEGPTRSISPTAGFFFFTICKGDNPTRIFWALYKAVKDAIDADPTLGGLCHTARVTGYFSDKSVPQISARVHTADIFVEVEYRHERGNA